MEVIRNQAINDGNLVELAKSEIGVIPHHEDIFMSNILFHKNERVEAEYTSGSDKWL